MGRKRHKRSRKVSGGKVEFISKQNIKNSKFIDRGRQQTCHSGLISPFSINECKIYLGTAKTVEYHDITFNNKWDLVINLSGLDIIPDWPVTINKFTKNMPRDIINGEFGIPELKVDWPDGDIPLLPNSWFRSLYRYLSLIKGNVVICCVGGHGRTGTLAIILAGLANLISEDACPVTWLRNIYCKEVVETEYQIELIESVLKRRITFETNIRKKYRPNNNGNGVTFLNFPEHSYPITGASSMWWSDREPTYQQEDREALGIHKAIISGDYP